MLLLYLYTLIICHKSCNMLSILNKLTLQKEVQLCKILWQTICFWQKVKTTTTTKQKKSNRKNSLLVPGIELGNSCTQSGCVTNVPTSQLRILIVVKLLNCFDVMGRNVNQQTQLCRPHIFYKCIFLK